MNPEFDPVINLLFAIIILFLAVLLLVGLVAKIFEFSKELDYINLEIRRTTGEAQQFWKWERRRLWLSLLPFYRR